jgi:hypothetical protein
MEEGSSSKTATECSIAEPYIVSSRAAIMVYIYHSLLASKSIPGEGSLPRWSATVYGLAGIGKLV